MLNPTNAVGAGGTGGSEDAADVGNGVMTARDADGAIWGSSISFAGWSTVMSSSMS